MVTANWCADNHDKQQHGCTLVSGSVFAVKKRSQNQVNILLTPHAGSTQIMPPPSICMEHGRGKLAKMPMVRKE